MKVRESIYHALAVVARAAEQSGLNFVVGGSAGLMLQGLPLTSEPRDLDIYCDDEDTLPLFQLLESYAVDQPCVSYTDIYRSRLSHFAIHQTAVELVGGFQITTDGSSYYTDVKGLLIPYGEQIRLPELAISIPVVPLAHELIFNVLRDRPDRVAVIAAAFCERPDKNRAALERILASNSLSEQVKASIDRLIN